MNKKHDKDLFKKRMTIWILALICIIHPFKAFISNSLQSSIFIPSDKPKPSSMLATNSLIPLDSITKRSDNNFERLITRQYIINKVHESDKAGLISVVELEGEQVLKIDIPDSEYSSYIYYYDGGIYQTSL